MIKEDKNTELNIIDIFNNVSMCTELMKKYHTKTSIEAIGKYILDTQPINSNLLESFWVLEGLCEEAITNTQKLLTKNDIAKLTATTRQKVGLVLSNLDVNSSIENGNTQFEFSSEV